MAHPDPKPLEVFYDLAKSPPTHDYCSWLARCEEARLAAGADSLHIRIVPGVRRQSPRDVFYSQDRRYWRIQHLLMPLAWLLPSVTDVSIGEGEQTIAYIPPGGPKPPCLKAPAIALDIARKALPPKPVTISLRNSLFEPARNTDNAEWEIVAGWLQDRGYSPVIVPDAEADMEGRYTDLPFYHYRAAAYHPALRVAAYELAVTNLFICSGVQLLAMYCDIRLHSFKTYLPGIQCMAKEWHARAGWGPMHKWPGKAVYWEPDTAEFIISRLETVLPGA